MSQEEATRIARAVQRLRGARRPGLKVALPTVAALGAGTAVAIGSITGGDGTITGCYVTNTDVIQSSVRPGDLRIIDTSQPATLPSGGPNEAATCVNGEATITWNQRGPQGPQGPQGAQGPQGGQGPAGAQGATGSPLIGQTSFGFSGSGRTFLKLDGIKGESIDKTHKEDIELSSFSIGVSNASAHGSGGGGGAGKVSFQSFTITKSVDKASPLLFKAAATGKHFQKATIEFARKAGKGQQDYLVYKLDQVLISSIQDGTSQKGRPIEQITFNFAKIEETFLGTNGKPLHTVQVNFSQNKLN